MTASKTRRREFTLFPVRVAVGVLGFVGIVFQYVLKVTLSVAINGMVTNITDEKYIEDTCPVRDESGDETNSETGEFGWDDATQELILSSYYYGYIATQLLGGYSASRIGGRWVFGSGLLIAGLFTLLGPLFAYMSSGAFMATRVIVGLASGVVIPSMHVVFAKWFPESERQRLTGAIFSANYLGTLLSMALSGTMVKTLGWQSVFYIFGGITVALSIPWVLFVYSEPKQHPWITQKEVDYIVENGQIITENEDVKAADENDLIKNPWPMILLNPPMWAHCIVMFGIGWVNFTLLTELPTYMQKILHYDIDDAGFISALPYLFGWISCNVYSFLTDWFTKRGMRKITTMRIWDAVACIGTALCLLGVTLVDCEVTALITLFVLTMVARCAIYGGSYMNHLYLFPNAYGSGAGLALTISNVTGIVTPLVTSAFTSGKQTIQNWKYVFYTAMGVCAFPYIFFIIFGTADDQEIRWRARKQKKNEKKTSMS